MTHPMLAKAKREHLARMRMAKDVGDGVELVALFRQCHDLEVSWCELGEALDLDPATLKAGYEAMAGI